MRKDYFKGFKLFKIIQVILLVIFAITFFLFIYLDEKLRMNLYTNKGLLTIAVFLWAFMIYNVVCLVLDFYQLEGHIAHDNVLNRAVYTDSLTGIPNRFGCDMIFSDYSSGKDISKIGCALVSISNLEETNHEKGRAVGNIVLVNFSRMIERVGGHYGFVGRNNGNEFLAVIDNCDEEKMNKFRDELMSEVKAYNVQGNESSIEFKMNSILNQKAKYDDFTSLVAELYLEARG